MTTIREKLEADPELAKQVAAVFGPAPSARLVVRFDPATLRLWPATVRRRHLRNRLPRAVVTHYVEGPARTPSGGRYTRRQFTAVIDGQKWWGTVKRGTDIVRLRPAER